MAVEDIGLADPQALVVAIAAKDAYDFLGSPEGELAIANAVIYAATAPKSNAAYAAFKAAVRLAKDHGSLMPPKIILNAPTKLMREEGYGANYAYDHDEPDEFSGQDYWPLALGRQTLYRPVGRGFEKICARGSTIGRSSANKGAIGIDTAGCASYPPVRRQLYKATLREPHGMIDGNRLRVSRCEDLSAKLSSFSDANP